MKSHLHAGQYNLKGKKYKTLSCNCCEVVDLRSKEKFDLKKVYAEYDLEESRMSEHRQTSNVR